MVDAHSVRFGGRETQDGFLFELSGGALPLDFANTLDERPRGGIERLPDCRELLRWATQAGVLNEQQASRLMIDVASDPRQAARVHLEALDLRELIFTTVKATIQAPASVDGEVRQWNAWLDRVRADRRLRFGPEGLGWQDLDDGKCLDGVLIAVAKASIELFLDPAKRTRIRLCAATDCDWAFLDTSRRMNRVWCDMSVCGNRAKATRHYRRKTRK